jgi:predicted ATPase
MSHSETTLCRWLERSAEARFLVTSRERLRVPGEAVHELRPLDPKSEGVELFEARARGQRPGFLVEEGNCDLVRAIVDILEGLPLAIELAAAPRDAIP